MYIEIVECDVLLYVSKKLLELKEVEFEVLRVEYSIRTTELGLFEIEF